MAAKRKAKKKPRGGSSYLCPRCSGVSHVLVTRRPDEEVHRTRQCLKCNEVFTTVETAVAARARQEIARKTNRGR